MDVSQKFCSLINGLTPNLQSLYNGSRTYTVSDWKAQQLAVVTASGAAGIAIPGAHLATLLADLAFVVNRMGVAPYGIGAIKGYDAGVGNILEEKDIGAVLAYWSGDDVFQAAMAKGAADISSVAIKAGGKIYGKELAKVLTHVMLSCSGYIVGGKLGGKGMAKVGSKVAAKF
jgi:hypothetical protein